MDVRIVEELVENRLKRLLGKQILVTRGPAAITRYSGIRPEVFVHASKVEDFDGVMPDGAHTTRRSVSGPSTYKGTEEERPGKITITITCLSNTYKLLLDICHQLTPEILLSLELLPRVHLGSLKDQSVELYFQDFTASFHSAENSCVTEDDNSIFKAELNFHLNGFIYVRLTKKGGFKPGSATRPRVRAPRRPPKTTKKKPPSNKK